MVAPIDVQHDEKMVIMVDDNEASLTEDEIENFSKTLPQNRNWELNDSRLICKLFRRNCLLQEPAYHIQI